MARETPAMSSQYDNSVGSYIQEHPLDLTVRKNAEDLNVKKVQNGKSVESLLGKPVFPYWYSTYLYPLPTSSTETVHTVIPKD